MHTQMHQAKFSFAIKWPIRDQTFQTFEKRCSVLSSQAYSENFAELRLAEWNTEKNTFV
jgi:hypothetical protein